MDAAGKCFIIQPFDGAKYDKRCKDTFEPAIRRASLEPYRVDQDGHADVPIEAIEREIRAADVVFAEMSEDNANVWYELGFAAALGKEIVRVCSKSKRERLPFDVQHRKVLFYEDQSRTDFDAFESQLVEALQHVLERRQEAATRQAMKAAGPVAGLKAHEIAVLQAVATTALVSDTTVPVGHILQEVTNAGFTRIAVSLAIKSLVKMQFLSTRLENEEYDTWYALRVTEEGEQWLLDNEDKFQLVEEPPEEPPF